MDNIIEIRDALQKAWRYIEEAYKSEKLNSERALQAVIYRGLVDVLSPAKYTVLVEPGWNCLEPRTNECTIPDLVIVDVENEKVSCVLELKLAPHACFPRPKILEDLWKLDGYRNTKRVRLDIFGPGRNFDTTMTGQAKFSVPPNVALIFVDVSKKNDDLDKACYGPMRQPELQDLLNHDQFRFLCAATDESGNADFSIGKDIDSLA